jgi:hypothetical protein
MHTASPIVYASIVGLLLACSDSTGPSGSGTGSGHLPEGAFQVSPGTATLQSGQTFRFTTTYSGNPALVGTPGEAAWHSTNESVATVSGGLVRAVGVGQTRIVAAWGGYQASALLNVVGSGKKPEDLGPGKKPEDLGSGKKPDDLGSGKKHEDHTACLMRTYRAGQSRLTPC